MPELFDPEKFKDNLFSATLFISYYESLKDLIIENIQTFFCNGFDGEKEIYSEEYQKVLELDKKPENACLKWHLNEKIIDDKDYENYHKFRKTRNDLVHELLKNLINGVPESITQDFVELMNLKIKIEKWWILEFEIPINPDFDNKKIDEDAIITPTQSINGMIFTLLSPNKEEANYFKNRFESDHSISNSKAELDIEKEFFLRNEFKMLTLSASFARANIYNDFVKNIKETEAEKKKAELRKTIFEFIDNLIDSHYSKTKVDEDGHIWNILELRKKSKKHAEILNEGYLKFGICQKLLNLYLKYHWCSGLIDFEPPHFPLDRLIQEKKLKKVLDNWTDLDNPETYKDIINNPLFGDPDKLAEMELTTYNQINRNLG